MVAAGSFAFVSAWKEFLFTQMFINEREAPYAFGGTFHHAQ
jgi:ABC-type glycerol-3-phosphate transport system permease component